MQKVNKGKCDSLMADVTASCFKGLGFESHSGHGWMIILISSFRDKLIKVSFSSLTICYIIFYLHTNHHTLLKLCHQLLSENHLLCSKNYLKNLTVNGKLIIKASSLKICLVGQGKKENK